MTSRPGIAADDRAALAATRSPAQQRERFMAGLRRTETGTFTGRYTAIHPRGAVGAYQISNTNFQAWTVEAGIPNADWRDPAVQDFVVRRQLDQLYARYGSWDMVAVAWFAGAPVADFARTRGGVDAVGSITDTEGVKLKDYAKVVLTNMEAAPVRYGAGRIATAFETGNRQASGTPTAASGVQGFASPTSGLQQFLASLQGDSPTQVKNPLRAGLVRSLSTVSNMVAGGQRSALPTALPAPDAQGVPELEPSVAQPRPPLEAPSA